MAIIDVFNGDADGICALLQMRLADPQKSTLVTGVKRDIQLLSRVDANNDDQLNVFDISMEKNHTDLIRLLGQGVNVFYVDHHRAGEVPQHPHLNAIINTAPETCTSLLVNDYLGGQFKAWAITAAFGDNMIRQAESIGRTMHYSADRISQLEVLGVCLNYNGYGETIDDLHIAPDKLYLSLLDYPEPIDFVNDSSSCYSLLKAGYYDDLTLAGRVKCDFQTEAIKIIILPDEPWARRVSGALGNQLTNADPDRAHAVLTGNHQGGYLVSVRAPLSKRSGADEVCGMFPTGGGRAAAAGINHLPLDSYDEFVVAMQKMYQKQV
ncbi:DHH family phosphoesterase [Sedimenticola selenatireducens]|uniref:DHH family phosphoesterase n=1 Tax=Sedimenticola selenatireducens TaxID=191960 RepID=A0A558DQV6_9GAMM|nr:DHH family phosphoesterase [Sedimenticola selenatireducens]TVO73473.1 DHH family phosphoesterase [Sedimenticola selenatireducens]TVT63414.1 MAG: DHH family phosphoesterase [Sedimenticola selenatireducens]